MSDFHQHANASELRYILEVMKERSHLGLDSETAMRLEWVLARRIINTENASARRGASSMAVTVDESEMIT
jgi:hypothetical protein